MKKWISILLCLSVSAAFSGCGGVGDTSRPNNQAAGVNEVLEAGIAEAEAAQAADAGSGTASGTGSGQAADSSGEDISESAVDNTDGGRQSGLNEGAPAPEPADTSEAASGSSEGIDVDLTSLSSTMVYSEVYNMVSTPEKYIGKTVKMNGLFSDFYDEFTKKRYFTCIIQDATACCAQGIEFVLKDKYVYPDDYPENRKEVTVVGEFSTYKEGDYTYCTLKNADIVDNPGLFSRLPFAVTVR